MVREEGVEGEGGARSGGKGVSHEAMDKANRGNRSGGDTEARNRVNGSGGDDYQGGSGCGSGNKSEYLASVAVAEREDGVARVEGRDGHAKAKSAVAAVIAAGTAI